MATQSQEEKRNFLNQIIGFFPACIGKDVKYWIACQFALESDFGRSQLALVNNNFCGMKVPQVRITLALNLTEKGKFACFAGIYSNVLDYLLWLQFNRFTRDEFQDVNKFQRHLNLAGYCLEPDYLDRINLIYKQYYE